MSIISSKPQAHRTLIDPILVLFLFNIVLLMFFALSTGSPDLDGLFGSSVNRSPELSLSSEPSLAADQQYWAANCTDEWSADSLCETITLRTQSCSISVDSAYCSQYDAYLQTYDNP